MKISRWLIVSTSPFYFCSDLAPTLIPLDFCPFPHTNQETCLPPPLLNPSPPSLLWESCEVVHLGYCPVFQPSVILTSAIYHVNSRNQTQINEAVWTRLIFLLRFWVRFMILLVLCWNLCIRSVLILISTNEKFMTWFTKSGIQL